MVCTGNICRSIMAQVVLAERGGDRFEVDSVGISAEESGNPIDYRAATVLEQAGYTVPPHEARRVTPEDLRENDLVLAMTRQHFDALTALATQHGINANIRMYLPNGEDVPDPWYGSWQDFHETLATIEDVTTTLL